MIELFVQQKIFLKRHLKYALHTAKKINFKYGIVIVPTDMTLMYQ